MEDVGTGRGGVTWVGGATGVGGVTRGEEGFGAEGKGVTQGGS